MSYIPGAEDADLSREQKRRRLSIIVGLSALALLLVLGVVFWPQPDQGNPVKPPPPEPVVVKEPVKPPPPEPVVAKAPVKPLPPEPVVAKEPVKPPPPEPVVVKEPVKPPPPEPVVVKEPVKPPPPQPLVAMRMDPPKPPEVQDDIEEELSVLITEDQMLLSDSAVTLKELGNKFADVSKKSPNTVVIVQAQEGVSRDKVMQVMELARRAKLQHLAIGLR